MHDVLRTRVNDFAVKLANVNGTGSASANGLLMQAIFRMGIPVCGKNLFPSNIQGLPTWYEIRVNKDGYAARALDYDLMVAMNSQTYDNDIKEVRPGGYLLYDSSWPLDPDLHRDRGEDRRGVPQLHPAQRREVPARRPHQDHAEDEDDEQQHGRASSNAKSDAGDAI